MSTESEKYSQGLSGVGAPNYTSPAWRAGDLERSRKQLENEAARRNSSVLPPSSSTSSIRSESTGGGFTFFSVIVFVIACIYGLNVGGQHLAPGAEQQLTQYIGPHGLVSKNVFFWSLVTFFLIIGILIRKILRWVVGIGILVLIVGGVISLFIN